MSVAFNGTTQYATIGTATALEVSDPIVSCWIKTTQTTRGGIVNCQKAGSPYSGYAIEMSFATAGKLHFWDEAASWRESSSTANNGAWRHLFMDLIVGGNMTAYLDGSSVGAWSMASLTHSGETKYLARAGSADLFAGDLAEVAIYDRTALSGSVASLVSALAGGADPETTEAAALVGGWHLLTNSDTADFSGNGNNLSFTGSPSTGSDHPIGAVPVKRALLLGVG